MIDIMKRVHFPYLIYFLIKQNRFMFTGADNPLNGFTNLVRMLYKYKTLQLFHHMMQFLLSIRFLCTKLVCYLGASPVSGVLLGSTGFTTSLAKS